MRILWKIALAFLLWAVLLLGLLFSGFAEITAAITVWLEGALEWLKREIER